jgi:hypothetical protein
MNPYAPLVSHPTDIGIAWLGVVVWLIIVAALLDRRFAAIPIRSERMCSAVASAFLALAATISAVFVVGRVLLVWLKITSAFWFIWQLFYLMSVICVFRVLPFFALGLLCWTLIGRWREGFSPRSLRLTLACLSAALVDAAVYFWLCYTLETNAAKTMRCSEPAIASLLQSTSPAGRVAELGSLGVARVP